MTLQDLAFCQPSELEALSDQQLEEITKPFWPLCRPELAPKRESTAPKKKGVNMAQLEFEREKAKVLAMAKAHGVDIKL